MLIALSPQGHQFRPLPEGRSRAIETLTDDELMTTDWLVPALAPLDNLASPHGMAAISARLRATDGCPWDRRQTHASLRPFVLETIEIFGAHRAMFASNFPVDKLYCGYAEIWDVFRKISASLSEDERHGLFHRNAEAFYRI